MIDPAQPADFRRLFEEIPDPATWKGVVFAWPCDLSPAAEPSSEELMASQMHSCGGMLHLVQSLAMRPAGAAPLWLVTRNAFAPDIVAATIPSLCHSSVVGMARTIALEHPALWGGMVDIPLRPDDAALTQLARELECGSGDHVVIRGDRRFVARIEPCAWPEADPAALRADASYLITGGLGALALHVARWMVERGARSIVLLGRRTASPQAEAAISELRNAGAIVTYLSADVADADDLRRVFGQIEASLAPLRGVVHAAGIYGYDALESLDQGTLRSLLRPKVQGAWLLHQLTLRLDLDFFVCFSSVAALWGSKGQAHYAAANSFLDALAHYRRRLGLPALSIDWGPWSGGGMVTEEANNQLARLGFRSLEPADALAALERTLSCGEAQIAVADMDWGRFRELYAFGGNRNLLAATIPTETHVNTKRNNPIKQLKDEFIHLTIAERHDWLVAQLQREVGTVLGSAANALPDVRAGFFRLGMDSLMAVDLRDRLARTFDVPLSATIVFDYPTVAELADFLAVEALGWEKPAQGLDAKDMTSRVAPDDDSRRNSDGNSQESIASKLARLETLMREV
jgi:NADP-dependent 3-hydroxy acid dehydrogenase YdfG/acyl carrier protein